MDESHQILQISKHTHTHTMLHTHIMLVVACHVIQLFCALIAVSAMYPPLTHTVFETRLAATH